jgi:hypothetical protein
MRHRRKERGEGRQAETMLGTRASLTWEQLQRLTNINLMTQWVIPGANCTRRSKWIAKHFPTTHERLGMRLEFEMSGNVSLLA